MLSARFGRTPSLVHRPARVRQIKLAVDDDPGLGIDRVLVRLFPGAAHSAVTVVLRRVMLGIGDKEIAMGGAGKAPARIVPQTLELGFARRGLCLGEIGDGIIAADREPRFLSSGRGSEQGHEQRKERGRPPKRKKETSPIASLQCQRPALNSFGHLEISEPILLIFLVRSNASATRALLDNPPDPPEGSSLRKRKLAAILHADVVGFSRPMGEDEAGTHRALGELRSAVDPLITAHGGRIVGTAGDSVLADFSSVVNELSCALGNAAAVTRRQ
jgi:hypothetical protein